MATRRHREFIIDVTRPLYLAVAFVVKAVSEILFGWIGTPARKNGRKATAVGVAEEIVTGAPIQPSLG